MALKDKIKQLQEPFPESDIEWRVGSTSRDKTKGLALAYVTNRAIQQRLDDVFGIDGWQNSFKPWRDRSQICTISVWDDEKKEWISKEDGAENTDFEPTKGGLSDAMKRCAVQWGIGRYLYKLPPMWVSLKDGRHMESKPKLPKEFLPAGESRPEGTRLKNTVPTAASPVHSEHMTCSQCGKGLNERVYDFSRSRYGKPLCMDCQRKESQKNKPMN